MIRRYAFSGLVHLVQLSIAFLTLLNVDTNHPTDRRAEGSRVKDRRLLSVDRRAAAHVKGQEPAAPQARTTGAIEAGRPSLALRPKHPQILPLD
jgi:hypothetical protein